ncbi:MAG: hypothetical protein NZ941_04705 [Candidatus Caldarchaeum sp.]|nr:hypothetical protein [Candidatus Caldarchaeum sp.]MDW7977399.1 hypothetical protein [Candidatus Caldarchaeum sp.]
MKAFAVVDEIRRERRRGSTALAWKVLEAYRTLAEESVSLERDVWRLAEEIKNARPAMPLVNRFSEEVLKRVERFEASELLEACREVEATYRNIMDSVVENAVKHLTGFESLATMSHSGTVLNILKKVETTTTVYVLESRPLREGLLTASELRNVKRVVVCVDAAAGYAVDSSDGVLVGGDAVFPDGCFSSKVGVKALALLARDAGKPFYVVCDTWKAADIFVNEHGPAEDVEAGREVEVLNPVFEKVSGKLVSALLTERGVFTTI